MVSVGVISDLFIGEADECERIVAALQYCASLPVPVSLNGGLSLRPVTMNAITTMLEKGVLYRGMVHFEQVSLLNKCSYITQKFTEIGERLDIIGPEVELASLSLEDTLFSLLSRVRDVHRFITSQTPLLKVFQLVHLGEQFLVFHPNFLNVEESIVLVISEDSTVITFSWANLAPLFEALERALSPRTNDNDLSCTFVCLLREVSTLANSISHIDRFRDRENFEDQVIAFQHFMQKVRENEYLIENSGSGERTEADRTEMHMYSHFEDGKESESKYTDEEEEADMTHSLLNEGDRQDELERDRERESAMERLRVSLSLTPKETLNDESHSTHSTHAARTPLIFHEDREVHSLREADVNALSESQTEREAERVLRRLREGGLLSETLSVGADMHTSEAFGHNDVLDDLDTHNIVTQDHNDTQYHTDKQHHNSEHSSDTERDTMPLHRDSHRTLKLEEDALPHAAEVIDDITDTHITDTHNTHHPYIKSTSPRDVDAHPTTTQDEHEHDNKHTASFPEPAKLDTQQALCEREEEVTPPHAPSSFLNDGRLPLCEEEEKSALSVPHMLSHTPTRSERERRVHRENELVTASLVQRICATDGKISPRNHTDSLTDTALSHTADGVSESLLCEEDSEDLTAFSRRAYALLRERAIDAAAAQSLSVSLSQSQSLSHTLTLTQPLSLPQRERSRPGTALGGIQEERVTVENEDDIFPQTATETETEKDPFPLREIKKEPQRDSLMRESFSLRETTPQREAESEIVRETEEVFPERDTVRNSLSHGETRKETRKDASAMIERETESEEERDSASEAKAITPRTERPSSNTILGYIEINDQARSEDRERETEQKRLDERSASMRDLSTLSRNEASTTTRETQSHEAFAVKEETQSPTLIDQKAQRSSGKDGETVSEGQLCMSEKHELPESKSSFSREWKETPRECVKDKESQRELTPSALSVSISAPSAEAQQSLREYLYALQQEIERDEARRQFEKTQRRLKICRLALETLHRDPSFSVSASPCAPLSFPRPLSARPPVVSESERYSERNRDRERKEERFRERDREWEEEKIREKERDRERDRDMLPVPHSARLSLSHTASNNVPPPPPLPSDRSHRERDSSSARTQTHIPRAHTPQRVVARTSPHKAITGGVAWKIDTHSERDKDRERERESDKVRSRSAGRVMPTLSPVQLREKENVRDKDSALPLSARVRRERDVSRERERKPNTEVVAVSPKEKEKEREPVRSSSAAKSRPSSRSAGRPAPKLSNYAQIYQTKNAVVHVCLAGAHQEERRVDVLDLLDLYCVSSRPQRPDTSHLSAECTIIDELKGQISQFVLMFHKSKSLAFKGVYAVDSNSKNLVRIYGKGPPTLSEDDRLIKEFLKFETSSKAFKDLPVRSVSSTVDAIVLEPMKTKLPL